MKELKITIPGYLTVDQYRKMIEVEKSGSKVEQLVQIVSSLSGYPTEEVKQWPVKSLVELVDKYNQLVDVKNEFHPLIEFNGVLYGYTNIHQASLGTYIDLESLTKDSTPNLHKIAATLYRPVKKHRFNSLSFAIKNKFKLVNNKVENVFDWYTLEKYDAEEAKDRAESFRDFPAHILLGAVSFFLANASLYLTNSRYSQNLLTKSQMNKEIRKILQSLSQSIGGGSVLSITSPNPTYSTYQATEPLQIST